MCETGTPPKQHPDVRAIYAFEKIYVFFYFFILVRLRIACFSQSNFISGTFLSVRRNALFSLFE